MRASLDVLWRNPFPGCEGALLRIGSTDRMLTPSCEGTDCSRPGTVCRKPGTRESSSFARSGYWQCSTSGCMQGVTSVCVDLFRVLAMPYSQFYSAFAAAECFDVEHPSAMPSSPFRRISVDQRTSIFSRWCQVTISSKLQRATVLPRPAYNN